MLQFRAICARVPFDRVRHRMSGEGSKLKYYCFTFRSITRAQSASRRLDALGIRHTLRRTPKSVSPNGCGYCLRVGEREFGPARAQLVGYQAIYLQTASGAMEELSS